MGLDSRSLNYNPASSLSCIIIIHLLKIISRQEDLAPPQVFFQARDGRGRALSALPSLAGDAALYHPLLRREWPGLPLLQYP